MRCAATRWAGRAGIKKPASFRLRAVRLCSEPAGRVARPGLDQKSMRALRRTERGDWNALGLP